MVKKSLTQNLGAKIVWKNLLISNIITLYSKFMLTQDQLNWALNNWAQKDKTAAWTWLQDDRL